jgi:hypothetical protein
VPTEFHISRRVLGIGYQVLKAANEKTEAREVEFEVLPANRKPHGATEIDEAIGAIAHVMDSLFRVPGTKFRFGVNPLIGFVPVVGDQIDAAVSASLLLRCVKHRLPKIVLARMGLNVLLNAFFQGIPIVGDFVTFVFKANQQNYRLLQRYAGQGKPVTRGDWIFVFGIIGGSFGLAILFSFLLVYAVVSQFRPW